MEVSKTQEYLNSIRNEMTHLWGAAFIVGGGALSLLLIHERVIDWIFGFIGLIVTFVLVRAYGLRRSEMLNLINKIKGDK